MPRAIRNDTLLEIASSLTEANASSVRGLSIPEISEVTGIHRNTVRRIIERPEYGFTESVGRSETGAITYYHDSEKMLAHSPVGHTINPLKFDDAGKREMAVHSLMTVLRLIDPTNELVAHVGDKMAKEEAKGKTPRKRNYFDWLFIKHEDALNWLTENKKAKDLSEDKEHTNLEFIIKQVSAHPDLTKWSYGDRAGLAIRLLYLSLPGMMEEQTKETKAEGDK